MSDNQTRETGASVAAFIKGINNETRRADAAALVKLMSRITGVKPKMWGPSIVGFGKYHYQYDSGREGEMLRVGFSPRKSNLALYLIAKPDDYADRLSHLGKHKTGGSCLYVNKLSDVDLKVLEEMIRRSWQAAREKYGK